MKIVKHILAYAIIVLLICSCMDKQSGGDPYRDGSCFKALFEGKEVTFPAEYDSVVMMKAGLPFYMVRGNEKWGVYNVQKLNEEVSLWYSDIEVCQDSAAEENTWTLMGYYKDEDNGVEYGYKKFFKAVYQDTVWVGYEYDTPYKPSMEGELSLRYSYDESADVLKIDRLLGLMMDRLWSYDDNGLCADIYLDWTKSMVASIDSLYENEGMFRCDTLSRYEAAVQEVLSYVGPSEIGTQREMNNLSYIYAITSLFLLHIEQISLDEAYPSFGFLDEYKLYSKFMTAVEDWESKLADAKGLRYSCKPMEDNDLIVERADSRKESVRNVVRMLKEDFMEKAKSKRPTEEYLQDYFHKLTPGLLYPATPKGDPEPVLFTDTVGMYLMDWVKFRDKQAEKLPGKASQAYRNQTTNLIWEHIKTIRDFEYK